MDSEDMNSTRKKPNKNRNTRFVFSGDLEYKASKTDVQPKWFNTETNSVFIQVYASCMLATWLTCMHATWRVSESRLEPQTFEAHNMVSY
jgi:hypothetical protein